MPEIDMLDAVTSEVECRCAQLREAVTRELEYARGGKRPQEGRRNEMGRLTAEVMKLSREASALMRSDGGVSAEARIDTLKHTIEETLAAIRASMESLNESKETVIQDAAAQNRRTHAIRAYASIAR